MGLWQRGCPPAGRRALTPAVRRHGRRVDIRHFNDNVAESDAAISERRRDEQASVQLLDGLAGPVVRTDHLDVERVDSERGGNFSDHRVYSPIGLSRRTIFYQRSDEIE